MNDKTNQPENKTLPETAFDASPNWAKDAIWYQIFVERFRNGINAHGFAFIEYHAHIFQRVMAFRQAQIKASP